MMCQLWLPTISQVLWSCWVHFFGVLLFTENTSSLILPIVNTKSKSSVHFLWNEDEHQQGPPGLLWATSKKNSFMVSEMKQAYTEMLRIISTWTSRSVIQTECDLYCIGKLSSTFGNHRETGKWGCLPPTSDQNMLCQVPSNLAPSWVRLVHWPCHGRGENPQAAEGIKITVSLSTARSEMISNRGCCCLFHNM